MKLTSKTIENLRPGPVRREIPDGYLRGLYLIVQPSGARSWAVRYRHAGRPRKFTLGPWPLLDLALARQHAAKALRAVTEGADPADAKGETRAPLDTVERVVEEFLERHVRRNCRPRTIGERERQFRNHVLPRWRHRQVGSVSRRDVVKLLDEVVDTGPVAANRLRTTLTTFFNWCLARDIVPASPMAGVQAPSVERSRDRVLDDRELAAVWRAAGQVGFPFGPVVQLLILTGCRRSEVAGMKWDELDRERGEWVLPRERVKNAREYAVPLSEAAAAVLAGIPRIYAPCVFTSGKGTVDYTGGKKALDALLPPDMPHWTLHDLRRSAVTRMADIGIAPHIIEAVVNHTSGHRGGVAGIYNRSTYATEKREALETWGRHVSALTRSPDSVVVPLTVRG